MERARDHLLARSGLAGDEDRRILWSYPSNGGEERPHHRCAADDSSDGGVVLGGNGTPLEQFRHACAQDLGLDGFGEKIIGAGVDRAYRAVDSSVAADHEDGDGLAPALVHVVPQFD